eukprot:gene50282-61517_t
MRLRDLGGLIVIDFIDMEYGSNIRKVEKAMKDALRNDRARIQVGRISGFGLMEMSRQRLRPGMLESTTQPCPHCHGTGLIRSDDSMALQVLRALEEEGTRKRSKEVLLKAPIGIVNFLFNQKREHIALIEARYGMSVRIEADPSLISPDYAIEKFKTATRLVAEHAPVISGHAGLMGDPVDEIEDDIVEEDVAEEAEVEGAGEALEDGLGHVVGIAPTTDFDVQSAERTGGKGAEEFFHELVAETVDAADGFDALRRMIGQEGPTAEVEGDFREGFVHRQQPEAVAGDARLVAESFTK